MLRATTISGWREAEQAGDLNPEPVRLSAGRDLDERVAEGGPVADVTQAVACEGVDAGPVVRPVSERRRHHARQDAVGYACAVGHRPALVPDPHRRPIRDAARRGVIGMDLETGLRLGA